MKDDDTANELLKYEVSVGYPSNLSCPGKSEYRNI